MLQGFQGSKRKSKIQTKKHFSGNYKNPLLSVPIQMVWGEQGIQCIKFKGWTIASNAQKMLERIVLHVLHVAAVIDGSCRAEIHKRRVGRGGFHQHCFPQGKRPAGAAH